MSVTFVSILRGVKLHPIFFSVYGMDGNPSVPCTGGSHLNRSMFLKSREITRDFSQSAWDNVTLRRPLN